MMDSEIQVLISVPILKLPVGPWESLLLLLFITQYFWEKEIRTWAPLLWEAKHSLLPKFELEKTPIISIADERAEGCHEEHSKL